jgi:isochorismate synthase
LKSTSAKDIATLYKEAQANGLAFVSFRLPDSKTIKYLTGNVSRSLKDKESAFAFAAFDPKQKPYYIKQGKISFHKKNIPARPGKAKQRSTTKKQYTALVGKIIAKIKSEDYKKIVAARVLSVAKPGGFDPVALFEKLCGRYAGAFVSLIYIPGVGTWIGASPEILVSETSAKLTTYSLAGTKVIDDKTKWTEKEKEEQEIVTDFIHKKLGKTIPDKITLKGPVTHEAGRVKHLLSVFTIHHKGKSIWKQVVRALHPTPAVGGMPQHKAVRFISDEESFDRSFYAGYLGPVRCNAKTDLFVNLRCMQVTDTQLLFYAGCGITSDSDPEREWMESERKIDILRELL